MKKLFYLVFVLCFGLVLCGCKDKKTTTTTTTKAVTTTTTLKGQDLYEIYGEMKKIENFTVNLEGEIGSTITLAIPGFSDQKLQAASDINIEFKYTKTAISFIIEIGANTTNDTVVKEENVLCVIEGFIQKEANDVHFACKASQGEEQGDWYIYTLSSMLGEYVGIDEAKMLISGNVKPIVGAFADVFEVIGDEYAVDKEKFAEMTNKILTVMETFSGNAFIEDIAEKLKGVHIDELYFTVKDKIVNGIKADIEGDFEEKGQKINVLLLVDGKVENVGTTEVTISEEVKTLFDAE